ncbi:MAG: cysteine peptidase family C39 domain-containing protein, partial [Candidatus Omnitrophica bacterium]|nr:cysteine peptidase family C39 domain-containing protein [Candidatus Omnitrophota bacterium]
MRKRQCRLAFVLLFLLAIFFAGFYSYLKTPHYNLRQLSPEPALQLTQNNRCGPDSLYQICKLYGISSSPEEIAQLAGITPEGTTALGLAQAAKKKGLEVQGVVLALNELRGLAKKAIVVLNNRHYVAVDSFTSTSVVIYDGAEKKELPLKTFASLWNKNALIISQAPWKLESKKMARLSAGQMKRIIAGAMRRGPEGGWTKDDPGVLPDGSWHVDFTNLGPIISADIQQIAPHLMPNLKPAAGLAPNPAPSVSVPTPTTVERSRVWL